WSTTRTSESTRNDRRSMPWMLPDARQRIVAMAIGTAAQSRRRSRRSVEVSDDLTSQSRHSLLLQGLPPSGKLLLPLKRRDVRVVEGARLENESGDAHRVIQKDLFSQSSQRLPATRCSSM